MRISYIIATLLLAGIFTSCTRENKVIEPAMAPVGDTGGYALVNIMPIYFNKGVSKGIVYIAYNSKRAKDFVTQYNDSSYISNVNGKPTASFGGLKPGTYYLYAEGTYTEANMADKSVKGGAPFVIVDSVKAAVYNVQLDLR